MYINAFGQITPTPAQREAMHALRPEFAKVALVLDTLVPAGRYKALALTALEEAAMWANKGITHVALAPSAEPAPRPAAEHDKADEH